MTTEYQMQKSWFYCSLDWKQLSTFDGEPILVLYPGDWNSGQGPDFKNAQLIIGGIEWHGHIELHLKTSLWFLHAHTFDPNYKNVILHVVWEHDCLDFNQCPVLELSKQKEAHLVETGKLPESYQLPCHSFPKFPIDHYERYFNHLASQRLIKKLKKIQDLFYACKEDIEEVLWIMLARSFGQTVNADTFEEMARTLPFRVLKELSTDPETMLIIFMGQTGLLDFPTDDTLAAWKGQFFQLQSKYRFKSVYGRFYLLRMRPANFPLNRLKQLCLFISRHNDLYRLFSTPEDICSFKKAMNVDIGPVLLQNIYLNLVIPFRLFLKGANKEMQIEIQHKEEFQKVNPEDSRITRMFRQAGLSPRHAFDTQGMIELYQSKCHKNDCHDCPIASSRNHQLKSTSNLISG